MFQCFMLPVFIFKKYFEKATEVNIGLKLLSIQTHLTKPLVSWVPSMMSFSCFWTMDPVPENH